MARARISDLAEATEADFQKEYQELRPLLQKEAQLQAQLVRLDAQLAQVKADSIQTEGYHVTGGDMLWHGWESATRRQLNMELAQVRAQKLAAMEGLRKAFGRKQAVENLSRQAREQKRQKQQKAWMRQITG
ncbi:hypothetical protein [Ruegeria sp.]|uniref:hypothetical protein n=1 Tax=Ruegeria sp. TaxID=1879320 RepID=UPI00230B865D|nr:hypothetical protein [Ruegeria sp.]MDA7964361.1 hypothetical protein [Ruegeria sp.]